MSISGELLEKFTPKARRIIIKAQERGDPRNVNSCDVLVSLLRNGGRGIWSESLKAIGVEGGTILHHITTPPLLSFKRPEPAEEALELALDEAMRLGRAYAGCEALLLGLIRQGDRRAGQVLIQFGANLERTRREVERLLRQFARNLTQAAIDGELAPVIGRKREIERILHILFRDPSRVPVLVGETGIGKTSVVYGLAQRIAANEVPPAFASTQVTHLDLSAIEQTLGPNELDELDELVPRMLTQRDVLVFIDGDQVREIGRDQVWKKGALEHDDLRVIGAMTPVNYRRMTRDRSGPFAPVTVDQVSVQETIQILEGPFQRGGKGFRFPITSGAMGAAVWYAREKLEDPVPGSALKLLDEAVSLGELRGLSSIDEKTVAEAVAGMLGVTPDQIEEAPRVQAPVAKVKHDKEIWEMS